MCRDAKLMTRWGKLGLEGCLPLLPGPRQSQQTRGASDVLPSMSPTESSPNTPPPSPHPRAAPLISPPSQGLGGWAALCNSSQPSAPRLPPQECPLPGRPPLSFPSFTLTSSKRSFAVKSSGQSPSLYTRPGWGHRKEKAQMPPRVTGADTASRRPGCRTRTDYLGP